jgi:hypothetical protein
MLAITLYDLLKEAEKLKDAIKNIQLDDSQAQGFNNVVKVVRHGGMSLGVGPPGTGKTVIFSLTHNKIFDELDKDEVILYIAPTNRLVAECAIRTLALLLNKEIDEKDINKFIRVYGSRFIALPLNEDVKYVFTTPYQPGALMRLLKSKKRIHIMVDEASTTPLHQPFISIAMAMSSAIRERAIEWFNSFSVIGDPMQAIIREYSGKEKFELLIVSRVLIQSIPRDERVAIKEDPAKIFELANKYAPSIGIEYFFLNNTYRIPKPTELLVSIPFYNFMLEGVEDFRKRLKGIKRDEPSLRSKVLERSKRLRKEVAEVFDNALDSQIPIIYLKDKGFAYVPRTGRRPPELEELDIFRAELAYEIATYIATSTLSQISIEVLTPYLEMKTQIKMGLRRLAGDILGDEVNRRLKVSTIHSALGSEADVVIVAMGKEYMGEEETIYFQTPELLNIQYSRHRRMLIIIGNVEKMIREFEKSGTSKHIAKLRDALHRLSQQELIKVINIKDKY